MKYAPFHLDRGVPLFRAEIHWSIFPSFRNSLLPATFSLLNHYSMCWCAFGVTFLPLMLAELLPPLETVQSSPFKAWQLLFLHTFPEITMVFFDSVQREKVTVVVVDYVRKKKGPGEVKIILPYQNWKEYFWTL